MVFVDKNCELTVDSIWLRYKTTQSSACRNWCSRRNLQVRNHDGSVKRRTEEPGLASPWWWGIFAFSSLCPHRLMPKIRSGECQALYYWKVKWHVSKNNGWLSSSTKVKNAWGFVSTSLFFVFSYDVKRGDNTAVIYNFRYPIWNFIKSGSKQNSW